MLTWPPTALCHLPGSPHRLGRNYCCIPTPPSESLLPRLRLPSPLAGLRQGVWDMVALAAHSAMDAGRCFFSHHLINNDTRTHTFFAAAKCCAISAFWEALDQAILSILPASWRLATAAPYPFLQWHDSTQR